MEGQDQSPLMAMPTEIRLVILREVLSRKAPLFGRQAYMVPRRKQQRKTEVESKKEATRKYLPRAAKAERESTPQPVEEDCHTFVEGYGLSPAVLRACQSLLREGWPILYSKNTLAIVFQSLEGFSDPVPGCYICACSSLMACSGGEQLRLDECTVQFASRFNRFELRLDEGLETQTLRAGLRLLKPLLSLPSVGLSATFVG